MTRYRKKSVIVEARQVTKENISELAEWCGGDDYDDYVSFLAPFDNHEVEWKARIGDWLVCEDEIFSAVDAAYFSHRFEPADATVDHMQAAAPDLFRAAERLCNVLEATWNQLAGMAEFIDLRAALAKARGE